MIKVLNLLSNGMSNHWLFLFTCKQRGCIFGLLPSSSPVVFNQETRSAIVARIRTKYAENEFYGGIARRSMFNSTYRPVVAEWNKFLETCVNDNILEFRFVCNKKLYKFKLLS